MSWNDFYRRREIMDTAVRSAWRDARTEVPFDRITGAREVFGSEENLLLALHYRWMQVLSGHLRAEVAGPEDADGVPGGGERDHVDAVSRAWRAAVRENAALHTVLEANADRFPALRRAHEAELRMLALTAGLAEPHEPHEEVTRIGGTLVALLRTRASSRRATNPMAAVSEWLRGLAPTG